LLNKRHLEKGGNKETKKRNLSDTGFYSSIYNVCFKILNKVVVLFFISYI